eukprot:evm.model.scf_1533.1 EVM.evm.TU.scf_1533.1   scf_1533:10024-11329(+)
MQAPAEGEPVPRLSLDEDALFLAAEKFDWAEDVEEAMVLDGLDDDGCLSRILLENSSPKAPPLQLIASVGSSRRRRGGRGSGRRGRGEGASADAGSGEDAKKKGAGGKEGQPKGGKAGKGGRRGDRRGGGGGGKGQAGQQEARPPLSGRGQSKGTPRSARGQQPQRCHSVNDNRTTAICSPRYSGGPASARGSGSNGGSMSARGPPRHGNGSQSARGSGSQSARGSRADRSSNWNADKGTGSNGSDSHRSNKGPGGGAFRGQPPRTPRRGGERSGGRDREWAKASGRQTTESPGRKNREEAFGGGARGGSGRLCRREPLGSHN